MRFGTGLIFVFGESWTIIRRGWWLALLPFIPPLTHDISARSIRPDLAQPILWSTLALSSLLHAFTPYWVVRFIALRHDFAAALSVNRESARTFAPYFVTTASLTFASHLLQTYSDGLGTTLVLAASVAIVLLLFSSWVVTAPSGSAVIGPIRSAGMVLPHLTWALILLVLASLLIGLVESAVTAIATSLPGGRAGEQSLPGLALTVTNVLFGSLFEVVFVVCQFVVAYRAGLRVGEDRRLAAVFE